MGYDEYQLIRFWPNAWPWHTGPIEFGIQCFHRGYIYQDAVKLHIVEGGQVQDYLFSTNEFGYGSVQLQKPLGDNLHFSGFKVIDYPRTSKHRPEVFTIQGASYFRPIGTHQRYGSSGRAVGELIRASRAGRSFRGSRSFGWRSRLTLRTTCKSMRCWTARVLPALFRFGVEAGGNDVRRC